MTRISMTPGWRWALRGLAGITGLLGLGMIGLGAWLLDVGGHAYYLLAGLLLAVAAGALLRGWHATGLAAHGLALLLTLGWSFQEIAGKGWMPGWGFDLAGRAALLAVLFLALLGTAWLGRGGASRPVLAAGGMGAVAVVGGLTWFWERPVPPVGGAPVLAAAPPASAGLGRAGPPNGASEWTAFGGSNLGDRYSPAAQITTANVTGLREAWRFSTGDMAPNDRVYFSAQNTPLKIDDTLFICSASNKVFALDPDTGRERWRFDPQVPARSMESLFSVACRTVGYHERRGAVSGQVIPGQVIPGEVIPGGATMGGACARRIFVTTADSRLIARDARSGEGCDGFGQAGTVDLSLGMAMGETGFASSNSGPAVVGDLVIVGQQVSDNQRRDAPSGVVRAYDATTGALRWAWDAKRLDRPMQPLAPGEIWPRGTPNVWNVISADESLGLVYLGTGNAANDHFGGNRAPEDDAYSAAVVAVDMADGTTRWSFRTVERDRWDYDIGAQPVVTDLTIDGRPRRALLQATKTGSLFALDVASGEPLRPMARDPAPGDGLPGEVLSPTQPRAAFFPNLAGAPGTLPERLDARHAFGLTPIDAALCRIAFHRMRYDGIYTPPSDRGLGTLLFPGTIGGPNWGGIAVDRAQGLMIANWSRLPNQVRMVPREAVQDRPIGEGGARPDQAVAPQAGAPWGVDRPMWVSVLNVPCISPPWGYLAAVELATGRLAWSQPLGTGFDIGPLGLPTFLRIPIGTPNIGGAVVTAGGLTFIAAAQDDYLRAYETATGRLLWSGRLPAGGQASPISYLHEGRQYVAIGASGHARLETTPGDSLVVFALDRSAVP